jgi:hypothetical protein
VGVDPACGRVDVSRRQGETWVVTGLVGEVGECWVVVREPDVASR